jgi:hypothetical protein
MTESEEMGIILGEATSTCRWRRYRLYGNGRRGGIGRQNDLKILKCVRWIVGDRIP